MHSDHDIFIQGIEKKRRLKLTFSGGKNPPNLAVRECAPLHYSKGHIEGDDLDCYYLWDSDVADGAHFLALPPSQIVSMEMAEVKFNIEDFSTNKKTTAKPTKG